MSLAGCCLVSSPHLDDPNFFRSVVLIIAHSSEGCMGVILNRPTHYSVRTVLEEATQKPAVHEGSLYQGGPVNGPLMALHSVSVLSDCECQPGVYFTSNRSHLFKLAQLTDISLRLFDGYSGWGANQLEQEMEQGGWLLCRLDAEAIFGPDELLWETCLRRIGNDILSSNIPRLRLPEDPSHN